VAHSRADEERAARFEEGDRDARAAAAARDLADRSGRPPAARLHPSPQVALAAGRRQRQDQEQLSGLFVRYRGDRIHGARSPLAMQPLRGTFKRADVFDEQAQPFGDGL
jgi:hypothetical protein